MIQTMWGYDIDGESIPDILSAEQFNNMTADRFKNDTRIDTSLKGAQDAARHYCGWHIAPSLECEFHARFTDKRVIIVGRDILIMLPARFISSVISVDIAGIGYHDYAFDAVGVLRIYDAGCHRNRKDEITVRYIAGLSDPASVQAVISDRVTHSLASPQGIASETTGSVSVSYSSAWSNGGNVSALTTSDCDVLETYRLQEVF